VFVRKSPPNPSSSSDRANESRSTVNDYDTDAAIPGERAEFVGEFDEKRTDDEQIDRFAACRNKRKCRPREKCSTEKPNPGNTRNTSSFDGRRGRVNFDNESFANAIYLTCR